MNEERALLASHFIPCYRVCFMCGECMVKKYPKSMFELDASMTHSRQDWYWQCEGCGLRIDGGVTYIKNAAFGTVTEADV